MTSVPPLCGIVSALLHYFMLVFFTWTAVEAIFLYIKLVQVLGTQSYEEKFILKSGIPAWSRFIITIRNYPYCTEELVIAYIEFELIIVITCSKF